VSLKTYAFYKEAIQAVTDRIAQQFDPQKIILFGSRARGDAHDHSDVDLLVVLDEWTVQEDPEVAVALSVPHPFPIASLMINHQAGRRKPTKVGYHPLGCQSSLEDFRIPAGCFSIKRGLATSPVQNSGATIFSGLF
jgi:hypothetical protein